MIKVYEGEVFDEVPDQEDTAQFAPLLKIAEDCYLTCGALVNRGWVGKKIRVTVEVLSECIAGSKTCEEANSCPPTSE